MTRHLPRPTKIHFKTCIVIRIACWNKVKGFYPIWEPVWCKNSPNACLYISSILLSRFIVRDWGPGQATYTSRDLQLVHEHFCILQKKRGQLEGKSSTNHEKTYLVSIALFYLPAMLLRYWPFRFCTASNAPSYIFRVFGERWANFKVSMRCCYHHGKPWL